MPDDMTLIDIGAVEFFSSYSAAGFHKGYIAHYRRKDNNEYRVGVYGSNESKKCDFYINGKLKFERIPFRKGNSISVLNVRSIRS